MIAVTFCTLPDKLNSQGGQQTPGGGGLPANDSEASERGTRALPAFQGLWELLPEQVTENAQVVWQQGRGNQMAVVSVGLFTCLTAVFLAGPVR